MPNGKGLLLDITTNKVQLQGMFKDGVIVSGNYYKEKEKVFEGQFYYDWGEKRLEEGWSIYNIRSIEELTERVRMLGWVNLQNGVNIFGQFEQFKDENITGKYKVINQNSSITYKGNMSNGQKKGQGQYKIMKESQEDQIEIKGEWGGNQVTGVVTWDARSQIAKSYGKFRFREQDIIMEQFGVQHYKNESVHRGFYQDNNLIKIGEQNVVICREERQVKVSCLGHFKKGLQSGFGVQEDQDLADYQFKGTFVNNQKHGYGYYYHLDTLVLEGYFQDNQILAGWLYLHDHPLVHKVEAYSFIFHPPSNAFQPQGSGRIYLRNRVVIECNLNKVISQLNKTNFYRIGLMVFPEGKVYEGEINSEFKMHGWGKIRIKGGKLLYEGQFRNDYIQGFGRYYNKNGTYHLGNLVKGFKQGFGIQYSDPHDLEQIQTIGNWQHGLKQNLFKQLIDQNTQTTQLYLSFKNDQIQKVLLNL